MLRTQASRKGPGGLGAWGLGSAWAEGPQSFSGLLGECRIRSRPGMLAELLPSPILIPQSSLPVGLYFFSEKNYQVGANVTVVLDPEF